MAFTEKRQMPTLLQEIITLIVRPVPPVHASSVNVLSVAREDDQDWLQFNVADLDTPFPKTIENWMEKGKNANFIDPRIKKLGWTSFHQTPNVIYQRNSH